MQIENDIETYKWSARILKVGMYISFAAMGIGIVWWIAVGMPGGSSSASRALPINVVLSQLFAGNPLALVDLGVLLLLATPAATLFSEIITYALARNWRYAGIASIVGIILLFSFALTMKWIRLF